MIKLKLKHCKLADEEHEKSIRQYAHVFHYNGSGYGDSWNNFVVCLTKEFDNLPDNHKYGILAHEIGHIIAGKDSNELMADLTAKNALGVIIRYKDSKYGNNLQFLSKEDLKIMEQLIEFRNK